jgi:hypothetical protein
MKNFNNFESNITTILKEEETPQAGVVDVFTKQVGSLLSEDEEVHEAIGDALNSARKALQTMTPGSEFFSGSGSINNKYDTKKNYYPNIRSGFMGLVNKGLDAASNEANEYIKKLIQQAESAKIIDPDTDIKSTGLSDVITEKYSKGFVSRIVTKFGEDVKHIESVMNGLQGDKTVISYKTLMDSIKDFNAGNRGSKQQRAIEKALEAYIANLQNPAMLFGMGFLQKSAISNALTYFTEQLAEWKMLLKATGSTRAAEEDTEDIIGAFLNHEGKVYRNLWVEFLKKLSNAVVENSQREWMSSVNTFSIVSAKLYGKYAGRAGEKELETTTISPKILEAFHNKVMVTRFLTKPNTLIYCTTEQWKSISEGGKLYKGATGFGRQTYTAGKNTPKVAL